MQGARVQFLGWEDLLEKGKATHASILAWRSPRTLYSPWSCKESDATFTSLSFFSTLYEGFPGGSVIKNLPDKQKGVWSLGQEDPLEEEMTTHSSILTWQIPWTEEPDGL